MGADRIISGRCSMDKLELPLGFGMALAQNEAAMQRFEAMTTAEKEAVIRKTRDVTSRREMQALVNSLLS